MKAYTMYNIKIENDVNNVNDSLHYTYMFPAPKTRDEVTAITINGHRRNHKRPI